MQTFKKMADVQALAEFAHRNQTDRAGYPYINHPRRVMESVQAQGAAPYVQMAAILHDVSEDTAFTPQMLLDLGVPEAAVNIVKLMDREYSRKVYEAHRANHLIACTPDEFYYLQLRANPSALMVKLADISDNTLPWRVAYLSDATRERLATKYANARKSLGA